MRYPAVGKRPRYHLNTAIFSYTHIYKYARYTQRVVALTDATLCKWSGMSLCSMATSTVLSRDAKTVRADTSIVYRATYPVVVQQQAHREGPVGSMDVRIWLYELVGNQKVVSA
jgi:hypothetical protein